MSTDDKFLIWIIIIWSSFTATAFCLSVLIMYELAITAWICLAFTMYYAADLAFWSGNKRYQRDKAHQIKMKENVIVYHGTRLPMDIIAKYGVPGMTGDEKVELYRILLGRIAEKYNFNVRKLDLFDYNHQSGVFVTDALDSDYISVKDFALCAPSVVGDIVSSELGLNYKIYDRRTLDRMILIIMDNIGRPKIIECSIPRGRFVRGDGSYGSVVDCILPSDIVKVHVIKYNTPKVDFEELKQINNRKEEAYVPKYQLGGSGGAGENGDL